MTRAQVIERLEIIVANSDGEYEIKVNDWKNYGKDRTYFSIVDKESRKYKEKKYGYYDNINNEYVPDKYGNAEWNHTVSGRAFA